MISSMTAFARAELSTELCFIICELRSVNHRYLDVHSHLPDGFKACEMKIRDLIREKVQRGKVDCVLRIQHPVNQENTTFAINESYARALCKATEQIATWLQQPAKINPTDILSFSGVLLGSTLDAQSLSTDIYNVVSDALNQLQTARIREGTELKQLFLDRLALMKLELAKVQKQLPTVLEQAKARLSERFLEAKLELDSHRIEQEMLVFAHKIDIAEEIERSQTHIAEIERILRIGGPVGRRLDFLLQELNREANTMGSKSADSLVTHAAVEMKVLIEQIREQIQNVE